MSRAPLHPHVARANAWARAVVAGKKPACQWVRLAAQRHLEDLKRSKGKKRWGFVFDGEAAERACRFIELLPLTKGRWAKDNEFFVLQDWQCFLTCVLFGWLDRKTGFRRFYRAFILIPRKNGKSEWAAAVGLYMLLADREHGAEVYSGATSEKQAWFVFGAAREMARRSPRLRGHFGLHVGAKNLSIEALASKFEPIIGKPGDGANPHCAIHDEYHEHATDDQVDAMLTGMGAREQPLQLIITTAGDDAAGPCYQAQLEAQKVLSGVSANEHLFAVLFGIDPGDDWTTEEALLKANPNAGVTISIAYLKDQQATAIAQPRKAARFKTKHLNVWVQAREAFYPIQRWIDAADPSLRLESFAGRRCYIGLDLAAKIDICSLVIVFEPEATDGDRPRYAVFTKHYLPEGTAERPENEHYQGWRETRTPNGGPAWIDEEAGIWGFPDRPRLTVTDGEMVDYDEIFDDIILLSTVFEVAVVAYDPHQATHLITMLMAQGVPVLEFRPTVLNFSEPMKETEALMLERRLIHDADPIMTWMLANVVAKVDAKDNVYPRKDAPENKIDGAVALISAFGAMKLAPESQESVYATRGVVEIEIEEV